MPNNTTIILTIDAPTNISKQIKKLLKGDKVAIDFNKIIPMPEELSLVSCGCGANIVSEAEYKKEKAKFDAVMAKKEEDRTPEERWMSSLPITKKMQKEYLKKYGSDNWYDWAIRNWGTKWNAYDIGNWKDGYGQYYTMGNTISFFTAWSVPDPIFEHLSNMFPKASFEVKYADEGGAWCGVTIWALGVGNQIDYQDDCQSQEYKDLYEDITIYITGRPRRNF